MTFYLLAILALLVLSALASGSETAVTGASEARIHQLAGQGDRRARIVQRLIDGRERTVSTILLSNNIFNILASALAADVFIRLAGELGVAYATAIMTILVVIFSEVLPKTYAIQNAERMALFLARPLQAVVWLLAPLTFVLGILVRWLIRLLRLDRDVEGNGSVAEQLRGTIAVFGARGVLAKRQRDMLEGVLDLEAGTVGDIMTHRRRMVTLNAATSIADAIIFFRTTPFTRIPLWQGEPEHIVGILDQRSLLDLVETEDKPDTSRTVEELMTPAWFVPERTTLGKQLQAFRRRRAHMALVVDEYGSLMGLVTLEDVLEEIVGNILDERDVETSRLEVVSPDEVVAEATLAVRDLNREMDWQLPEDDVVTLAGLVMDWAGRIPEQGETIERHGHIVEVLERRGHRLLKLRLIRLQEDASARS